MSEHFQQLLNWLDLESAAETERLLQRQQRSGDPEATGETLVDLVVTDQEPGLGGRTLITLVKRNRTQPLPWHRLRVGAPVVLTAIGSRDAWNGVVSGCRRDALQVAVNDWPDGERFRLDLSPDELTRRRLRAALNSAQQARGRNAALRQVLLGERPPRFAEKGPRSEPTGTRHLNPSQQEAIRFSLAAQDLAIIHGPPGTGKTTTVVELICRAVARGERVLACAPSNTAVDNLLRQLAAAGCPVVRLGHPARVDEQLHDLTLDAQVATHEAMGVVREMLREAEMLMRRAGRFTRARPAPGEKRALRQDARRLRTDARLLEQQAVESVLDRAEVVCATNTFPEELLGDRRFDLVVIDEACQSTEAACWIPILRGDRLVLAGDHCQLPPTVLSAQAARDGMATSLLERLVAQLGEAVTRQLDVQYRMHTQIMAFSSSQFYSGRLKAHESVAEHLLPGLAGVDGQCALEPLLGEPVTFLDTAGAGWDEEREPEGESRRNVQEAELILQKARRLREAGVLPRDIAVITPYAAQVRYLRERTEWDELEIDTVDGFQGREKEAVLISCVRSNAKGEIGFLSDTRRMNVALTRARRKLLVVGDSATIGGHSFYAALLEYFESIGAYHTVWEEPSA